MTPSRDGRHRRRAQGFLLVAVSIGFVLALAPGWGTAGPVGGQGQVREAEPEGVATTDQVSALPSAQATALAAAWRQVNDLEAQVQRKGGILPGFGRLANNVIKNAVTEAGVDSNGEEALALEKALDAQLHVLFQRQLHTVLVRSLDRYEEEVNARPNPYEAGLAAQRAFLADADKLVRPGSTWSFKAQHRELVERVNDNYVIHQSLIDEQAKQGQGKQVAIQVIKKLQEQSAAVRHDVETRGSLPWNANFQYFPEGSPLGFRGTYSKGRATLQFLVMPNPYADYSKQPFQRFWNAVGSLNMAFAFDAQI